MNKGVVVFVALAAIFCCRAGFCEDLSKDKAIAIATEAVKTSGADLKGVNILYDDGGKLWSEDLGAVAYKNNAPNFGILEKGFTKNYRIVFFDFKDPLPDKWVFIDKDTGEVYTVYTEQKSKVSKQ